MKNILLMASLLSMFACAPAHAQNNFINGKVVKVVPITKHINVTIPYEECGIVDVPVYGSNGTVIRNNPDVIHQLFGTIIGGAIGNQFGSGSGKDAMTVIGAIAGNNIATNRSRNQTGQAIVGYRQQNVCNVINRNEVQERIFGYETHIEVHNQIIITKLNYPMNVGDITPVRRTYSLN